MVFAHAGHWTVSLIYAAPVFILAGVAAISTARERRRRRRPQFKNGKGSS